MSDDLYVQLTDRIFLTGSVIIPQLFKMIADEDEARLMLATPGTAAQLAERLGRGEEEVQSSLDQLYWKGLMFKSRKPEGTIYRMCRDLVQFHDATLTWPDVSREYCDLWQKYMDEEWPAYAAVITNMIAKPFTRVVPVNQPLDVKSQILARDDVEALIDKAGRYAVTNCTCRTIARKCDKPIEVCLQIGKGADYTIDRGSGRELTRDEAMEIIRQSEEAGLVHVIMNKSEETHFICNCCDDCCQSFTLLISDGLNLCDPSRFTAVVDADACTGCGECLTRCYFGALCLAETEGGEVLVIDSDKCMGCGLCTVVCPEDAITMLETREAEFIPE
jgi:Pyruvate/2-oxoacid:ferredoxin oxidoreductase delta subunit